MDNVTILPRSWGHGLGGGENSKRGSNDGTNSLPGGTNPAVHLCLQDAWPPSPTRPTCIQAEQAAAGPSPFHCLSQKDHFFLRPDRQLGLNDCSHQGGRSLPLQSVVLIRGNAASRWPSPATTGMCGVLLASSGWKQDLLPSAQQRTSPQMSTAPRLNVRGALSPTPKCLRKGRFLSLRHLLCALKNVPVVASVQTSLFALPPHQRAPTTSPGLSCTIAEGKKSRRCCQSRRGIEAKGTAF